MKKALVLAILLALIAGHIFIYRAGFQEKSSLQSRYGINYVLPSRFTRITSLDFKGLAADFQLLEAIFFIGEKIENKEPINKKEWNYFNKLIKAVTNLDPYFYDPYYFASALLSWDAKMYDKAIAILKKAMRYRPEDRKIPFKIGFIYFYFLKDYDKGAKYISKAAEYPKAPAYYATLASRLAYYGGEHRASLALLKRILQETKNESIRSYYKKRIQALERAVFLEKAVQEFKNKNGRKPTSLKELVKRGLIKKIPKDPYGGKFVLMKNGRVYSTSRFVDKSRKEMTF